MPIYMTARFTVRPEAMQSSLQAIETFVAYVRDTEPGTQFYTSLQESENPREFLHVFLFDDDAAEQIHRRSEGVKRFTDVLYPGLEGDVEFKRYQLVATT